MANSTVMENLENAARVRHALHADLPAAAALLAEAFASDPWFGWLYPDGRIRAVQSSAWFELVLERAFEHGHTYVTAGGVINWIPPDVHFPQSDDVELAVRLLGDQIGDRAAEAFGVIGAVGAVFPDRPRFHCVYVGVQPALQRRGIGHLLFERVLRSCDAEGIDASLTSTNDANLTLYRALGFSELGEVPIPGTGRFMRPMWRQPRPLGRSRPVSGPIPTS